MSASTPRDTRVDNWVSAMERARARYEAGMSERRKCYQFAYTKHVLTTYGVKLTYQPIVPEHLERRIHWHKAWLDYGQSIGENEMFTAAVSTAHHPRRI